ncbi:ammonium transporter, partial [Bacillus amyloliquefaciens]
MTAGCNVVSPLSSLLIGAIGGVLVVLAIRLLDEKAKVDDPLGAIAVHGFCGVWGTLAVGFFGQSDMLAAGGRWEQ